VRFVPPRFVVTVLALGSGLRGPAVRSAAADPLWQAELRAGYGIAASGSGTQMAMRATPLTLEAVASFAFNETPPLAGYGGLTVETLDRNSVGAVFGVTLTPHGSHLRLSGGGTTIVEPYTLWGAIASVGVCGHASTELQLCADVRLTAYFAGSDLGDGRTISQAQLVLGVAFDAM
jgi:hypothetical protein